MHPGFVCAWLIVSRKGLTLKLENDTLKVRYAFPLQQPSSCVFIGSRTEQRVGGNATRLVALIFYTASET